MNEFPKTIIEIYDNEPMENILSIADFKPKNAVYLGNSIIKSKNVKNSIISFFKLIKLNTKCFFYSTDMMKLESVISEICNIADTFGDVAIDLTGGSEVALVAIGMLARERNIPLFRYDKNSGCYKNIYAFPAADGVKSAISMNVNSLLALHSGAMKSHGHLFIERLSKENEADIFSVWDIYISHQKGWNRTVSYLQQVSKNLYPNELNVSAKGVIFGEKRIAEADKSIMNALYDKGILKDYKSSARGLSFRFKNRLMRSCLTDIGICLELYVYAMAVTSHLFDDVQISVVIDWDGKFDDRINTINEIDVMLIRGNTPIFISCKSGFPNVTALNEIKMLAEKFGGSYAKPVLVTMTDVSEKDRYLYKRAEDMGIKIIERRDLIGGNLIKELINL